MNGSGKCWPQHSYMAITKNTLAGFRPRSKYIGQLFHLGGRGWSFQVARVFFKQNWKLQESCTCYFLLFWSIYDQFLFCFVWGKGLNTAASTTSLQKDTRHFWSCNTLSSRQSAKHILSSLAQWAFVHVSHQAEVRQESQNNLKRMTQS